MGEQELSAVFLMACETKVSRLVILGLGSLQKLVANEAIAPEPIPKLIQFLKLVSLPRSGCRRRRTEEKSGAYGQLVGLGCPRRDIPS
jgi:hypothetical protein